MLITGIKSRPVYDQLVPMASGLRHIAVAQGSGGKPVLRLLAEMTPASGRRRPSSTPQNHSLATLI